MIPDPAESSMYNRRWAFCMFCDKRDLSAYGYRIFTTIGGAFQKVVASAWHKKGWRYRRRDYAFSVSMGIRYNHKLSRSSTA